MDVIQTPRCDWSLPSEKRKAVDSEKNIGTLLP